MGKFLKGLSRDTNPVDQPSGTWRYARNMVVPVGSSSIQSERGNEWVVSIQTNHDVVGAIILPDERVCLFTTHNSVNTSSIGIFNTASNSDFNLS